MEKIRAFANKWGTLITLLLATYLVVGGLVMRYKKVATVRVDLPRTGTRDADWRFFVIVGCFLFLVAIASDWKRIRYGRLFRKKRTQKS